MQKFDDKSKPVCHGKLKFTVNVSGFEDVRTFIHEIVKHIQENGSLQ